MTRKQEELDERFQGALVVLNTHLDWLRWLRRISKQPPDDGNPRSEDMMKQAIDDVLNVYKDWRAHLGCPVEVDAKTVALLLRQLADRLEGEER